MGLFTNWFRKIAAALSETNNECNVNEEKAIGKAFFTNAPLHWGAITDEFMGPNAEIANSWAGTNQKQNQKQRFMADSLVLMGRINEALSKINLSKALTSYMDALHECKDAFATSCCINKLFEKGTIEISGIVIDNFERYGVILFYSATSIENFEELRTLFINDGYKDLIYFALEDPNLVTEQKKIQFENFNKHSFRYEVLKQGAEHRKYSEYAMWWATDTEPDFKSSSVRKNVGIYLDILDHHHSYALGILSFAFGLKQDNSRTRLPDKDLIAIEGPEGVEIMISLSESRGIHFHFPVSPRYERYRNNFIKVYVNFCYNIRAQILEHDFPKDDFGQPSSLDWYNQLLEEADRNNGEIAAVGVILKEKWLNFNLN